MGLFDSGLESRTIAGYRTAIASALDAKGRGVGSNVALSKLIKSFFVDRPVRQNIFPQWDLSIVLAGLRSSPFELKDMSKLELSHLTYKTVFLLMLASGARRGEIHALDFSKLGWSEGKNVVHLKPNPFFMAKTHAPDKPLTAFKGFSIVSLSASLGRDDPDRALCPVRSLKYYIQRTSAFRAGRKPLFLPLNAKSVSVKANTVSSWVKKAIKLAYMAADKVPELRELHGIRAHEVRALASSWDALKQVSFNDIMQACRWRNHTTFTDFYLRDMTQIEAGLLAFKAVPTPSMCRP